VKFTISVHWSQYFLFHHSTDLPAWNNLLSSMEIRAITPTKKLKTVLQIPRAGIKLDATGLCAQLQVRTGGVGSGGAQASLTSLNFLLLQHFTGPERCQEPTRLRPCLCLHQWF